MNEEINYGNVLELWATRFAEVNVQWLPKIQNKRQNAWDLYRFCEWAKMNPKQLLALKDDPASKEAEKLLDAFAAGPVEGFTNALQYRTVTAVKSFFKYNYKDLARASGIMELEKVKPYRKPTKENLYKLWSWCNNPRDRSIISLVAATAIAKETITKLKWGHLEDGWEKQEIPHISIPSKLIKGHGRGRYKGVRQETFLTPEAKRDLLEYKEWIEKKLGRKVTKDDHIYLNTFRPYRPLSYRRLGNIIDKLSKDSGVPFSLHDARRFVETALEETNIHPNWARKIRGRKVRGEESPYSQPEIEKLREAYRKALPHLSFLERPVISEEDWRKKALLDQAVLLGAPKEVLEKIRSLPSFSVMSVEDLAAFIREEIIKPKKPKEVTNDCNPYESRLVTEQELTDYLDQGWEYVAQVNGRVVVRRRAA